MRVHGLDDKGGVGVSIDPCRSDITEIAGHTADVRKTFTFNAIFSFPHMVVLPGVVIALTMLSFSFVGDGLRDAFDPRLRQPRSTSTQSQRSDRISDFRQPVSSNSRIAMAAVADSANSLSMTAIMSARRAI
jgi:hypothetical protein